MLTEAIDSAPPVIDAAVRGHEPASAPSLPARGRRTMPLGIQMLAYLLHPLQPGRKQLGSGGSRGRGGTRRFGVGAAGNEGEKGGSDGWGSLVLTDGADFGMTSPLSRSL